MTYTIAVPVQGQPVSSSLFGIAVRNAILDLDTRTSRVEGIVPQLVAQSVIVADGTALSGSTEALQTTVTIAAIAGQRYEVRFTAHVSSAVAIDSYQMKVREDNGIAGTQITVSQMYAPTTSTVGYFVAGWAQWTAVSTASKTFSLCLQRNGTSGTGQLRAGGSRPCYFQVWTAT